MKKLIVSLIVALSLFAGESKAQDTLSIAAGGQIFNLQPFANYNDSANFYIFIKNISTTSYSGYVTIQTLVDSGMISSFVQVQADSVPVFLNPGDSLPLTVFEIFTPQDYRVGGNIVVIWPSASNAYFSNPPSAADTVCIEANCFMNVEDISGEGFSVYPVPFQNSLYIVMESGKEAPEKIRLRDITGRLIIEMPYHQLAEFPEELSAGTYFLELVFENSVSHTVRLIKTK